MLRSIYMHKTFKETQKISQLDSKDNYVNLKPA